MVREGVQNAECRSGDESDGNDFPNLRGVSLGIDQETRATTIPLMRYFKILVRISSSTMMRVCFKNYEKGMWLQ
jgi:hypothetical protein